MPRGVYERKPGVKRGPYRKKQQPIPRAEKPLNEHPIAKAFEWLGEIEPLTLEPQMQARLDAIRAKRKEKAWKPSQD